MNLIKKLGLSPCLRRLSVKYPPRLKVLKAAKHEYYIKAKNGNDVKRVSFTCSLCKTSGIKSSNIQVDHIIPVIDVKNGWTDWEDYINRLFCDESNLQCICSQCHDKKTAIEREERK